ncbi:MAG TPA: hypothetical protein VJ770_01125 [Stellaceae bacterium]|nr:hypothetical protein [Stellaceae bacterium]
MGSPTNTIRFLTLEELAWLFAAVRASLRDRALFLIAYRHGLRASEIGLLFASGCCSCSSVDRLT